MDGTRVCVIVTAVVVVLCVSCVRETGANAPTGFYADNDLQQTVRYEGIGVRDKREMQQEILTLLGLHHRPKPKTHGKGDSAPKFMINLYEKLKLEDGEIPGDDDVHFHRLRNGTSGLATDVLDGSDVIMSFVNHATKMSHLRHERDRTFYFDFSELTPGELVSAAELRLFKDRPTRRNYRRQDMSIQLFRVSQGRDPEDKVLESVYNTTIRGDYRGWLKLNVTGAAEKWTMFPMSNLGLFLKITNHKGRDIDPKKLGIVGRRGSTSKQPFMVGYFKMDNDVHSRKRRSTRRNRHRSDVTYADQPAYAAPYPRFQRKACQRRTLYVSFRDLGWQDWIIAPDGYSAFYCDGECAFPLGAHMNATNHAIVQTLVHLMDPFMAPKPCCAPTKLTAISVLYFDHNSNVVLKKYKGMIVKACGCH